MSCWWLVVALLVCAVGARKQKPVLYTDVPFIECQVCQAAVHAAWDQAEALRVRRGTVHEDELTDITESLCDPETDAGEWASRYDLVAQDGSLLVAKQPGLGHCKKECETVAYACRQHLQEVQTELAEALYLRRIATAPKLASKVCRQWTQACRKGDRPPLPPAFSRTDEKWKEADEKAQEAMRMMRTSKKAGMGGMSMYSRDDLDELMAGDDMEALAEEFGEEL